ncbi:hypothetical protein SAMIE_1009150 [Sphingobium amiense]|uniref:Uncharacterized protein n=1 Tax=Sphingobium amiense TaxID=135719 RepID=A0A494VYC5_9SPHN|nr:hypothetical protein SAMIE_1009150 [Sphingobium amiense]
MACAHIFRGEGSRVRQRRLASQEFRSQWPSRPALRYRGLSLDPMPISAGRPSTSSARASPARRLTVKKRRVHHPVTQGLRCGYQKIQGFRLQPVHNFWERKYADKADINAASPVGRERACDIVRPFGKWE